MPLAYLGFTQEGAVRSFRFESQIPPPRGSIRGTRIQFTVRLDVSLFMEYAIPLQDGPEICRGVLAEALAGTDQNSIPSVSCWVQRVHAEAFVDARRAIADAKTARRRRVVVKSSGSPERL